MKEGRVTRFATLGRTGLRVSVAGLGCGGHSRLGQTSGATESDSVAVVERALDLGINFIDTAHAYRTERIVGKAIARKRHGVVISTKKTLIRPVAIGGHCSVNGTSTGKPLAQTLPPEIEIRDRDRKCGVFRTSRASRVAPTPAKPPKAVRKTRPRLVPVEIGRTAWRWTQAGANRSRPLDAAIAPRRPPRELAGFRETGLD